MQDCTQKKRIEKIETTIQLVSDNHLKLQERLQSTLDLVQKNVNSISEMNGNMKVVAFRTEQIEKKLDNGLIGALSEVKARLLNVENWTKAHGKKIRETNNRLIKFVDEVFNFMERHYKVFIVVLIFIALSLGVISFSDIKSFLPK